MRIASPRDHRLLRKVCVLRHPVLHPESFSRAIAHAGILNLARPVECFHPADPKTHASPGLSEL